MYGQSEVWTNYNKQEWCINSDFVSRKESMESLWGMRWVFFRQRDYYEQKHEGMEVG